MQTMRTQLAVIGGGPAGVWRGDRDGAARHSDDAGDGQTGSGRELEQ